MFVYTQVHQLKGLFQGKITMYASGEIHTHSEASNYSQTHSSPHRHLAYRDVMSLIKNFSGINKVLDFGSGTGISARYLYELGYEVIGVDKSIAMVQQAKQDFPSIPFFVSDDDMNLSGFDLVFSSFVMFEMSSKQEIVDYLNKANSFLRKGGVFVGITGSQELHKACRNWSCFDVNYSENINPKSGDVVKLGLKNPVMDFYDYYWTELDYKECFDLSEMELINIHYPLGCKSEKYNWSDELVVSPFVIFIAKKN